jgi:small-conductance mechanosensitive channel
MSLRHLVAALLLCLAAASAPAQTVEPIEAVATAPVVVDGQTLFAVRGTSALPAETRAARIRGNILAVARDRAFDPATIETLAVEDGFEIRAGPRVLRGVYDADGRIEGLNTGLLSRVVESRIVEAVNDYRAARSPEGVRQAFRAAGIATVLLVAALVVIVLVERASARLIARHVERRLAVWEERARNVVQLRAIWDNIRRVLRALFVLAGLVAVAIWIDAVLLALPWTRDEGRALATRLTGPLFRLGNGILYAIPDLLVLAVIVALIAFVVRVIDRLFAAVETGRLRLPNFEREWARPTGRLVRVAVILLGLVMAYPYIPGSSSQAFQAISLFAGIMLSLGASSLIANALAGNSLIYRRAFRIGDRVEIAGVVGDVENLTAQATYIRTPKNERVTLPNALVLGSQVTNFSLLARERGLILHTDVGIGYEVPWREVEAMLLEAARRTPGLLAQPAPFVLQKRLGDYSPVYEINGYTDDAGASPATYSALHACIQDVFAEKGIQIMTPSYVADPPDAKVPPAGGITGSMLPED